MSLQGKVALVTGATRGIGKAIANRLAQDGAKVVGTATSEAGAATIGEQLAPFGGQGRVLDVTDSAAVDALIADVGASLGAITILVNNAGITRDNLALRMKDEDWDAVIATNLSAVFRVSRAAMRGMMKARWGRIVNIGSVVGTMGNFGQANYAAAKAGLIGLSKTLAGELGARNVTVNVIAPGFIDTDMTRVLGEEVHKKLLERTLIPRLGRPEEIAAAVAYLVSEDAGYITGQTLHINGGMLLP
jgi:3-oxoacyl-[acyl-carrier protein] reductase